MKRHHGICGGRSLNHKRSSQQYHLPLDQSNAIVAAMEVGFKITRDCPNIIINLGQSNVIMAVVEEH